MADIIECPACSRDTPAGAETCRHCGTEIAPGEPESVDDSRRKRSWPVVLMWLALGARLKLCIIDAGG